jgi:hypothetical protein
LLLLLGLLLAIDLVDRELGAFLRCERRRIDEGLRSHCRWVGLKHRRDGEANDDETDGRGGRKNAAPSKLNLGPVCAK